MDQRPHSMFNALGRLKPGIYPGESRQRSAADCIKHMSPTIRESLSPEQQSEVERIVELALPKPAPKLVDLRFDIDLLVGRYFIVLFVGRDRRRRTRQHAVSPATAVGNRLAAVVLLLGMNLTVTLGLLIGGYLLKSAVGIDLLPGHFRGFAGD